LEAVTLSEFVVSELNEFEYISYLFYATIWLISID